MLSVAWIDPVEGRGFRDTAQVFLEQTMARYGDGMEEGPMLTAGLRREEWRVGTSVREKASDRTSTATSSIPQIPPQATAVSKRRSCAGQVTMRCDEQIDMWDVKTFQA